MRIPAAVCLTTLLAACATPVRDQAPPAPLPASTAVAPVQVPDISRPDGETSQWWFRSGAAAAAERGAMDGGARNVILFVGDGMDLTTVAAARILQGQRAGGSGEEHLLSWEHFPHTALSRTYNTDMQTPDSAGTMTAMATGVKTRAGVVNLDQSLPRRDCGRLAERSLLSVLELAQDAGMATGIVTTTRITHATPSATFARSPERNWEDDAAVPEAPAAQGCTDIAAQLVDLPEGRFPDVVLGGGRRHFLPAGQPDPEHPDKSGRRQDGRDLIGEWQARHPGGAFVWNREQMQAAAGKAPLLGLFEYDHLNFEHDRAQHDPGEPTLAELTREAIGRVQGAAEGYVLVIEAGRIDHAHHAGNAFRALTDTVAMADAVQAAVDMTDEAETLVLVTADHGHTLTFAGYPARGNPILDKVRNSEQVPARDGLGLPYTTLGYANGPGYRGHDAEGADISYWGAPDDFTPRTGRPDLTSVDTEDPYYQQEVVVPRSDETHGGQDVGIWARGPGAHAVRGTVEQNVIFHFMVQSTPRLRQHLCEAGLCNADGVPVELPHPGRFGATAP
ncbi:alkaline phosphatase [Luteimonas dalianensis]|uniref:alkaline phosphatase n=1 Tax=Luteimonas dalianensis TaxID=1148196 RepID=UPI003BF409A8